MTQPTYLFWQINPLAGIVDTDAIGWVPLRRRKTGDKIKKSDIRVRHLPQHLQADFSKIFTPELIRYAGSLPPWQNIDSVAEMAKIWDPLFPDYPLAAGPDLQAIVLKLGDDKITAWRNKFSTTALEALEEIFGHEGAETAQARADSVACLLEGEDKNFAFYYREYADEDENVIKKGLFQGHLIVRGLATHYASIRSPRAPAENPATADFPETPLVHTIQAAKRTLHYTETGKLVIPGHRLGEF
ncbi:hypothetical protein B0H14DRAFT_2501604, partial [Mycena olivaceomarginata]